MNGSESVGEAALSGYILFVVVVVSRCFLTPVSAMTEGETVIGERRGFMATSKVPPVMPAEAKRKGGGREKIGSRGVVVAAATAVVVVATTSSAVCSW